MRGYGGDLSRGGFASSMANTTHGRHYLIPLAGHCRLAAMGTAISNRFASVSITISCAKLYAVLMGNETGWHASYESEKCGTAHSKGHGDIADAVEGKEGPLAWTQLARLSMRTLHTSIHRQPQGSSIRLDWQAHVPST